MSTYNYLPKSAWFTEIGSAHPAHILQRNSDSLLVVAMDACMITGGAHNRVKCVCDISCYMLFRYCSERNIVEEEQDVDFDEENGEDDNDNEDDGKVSSDLTSLPKKEQSLRLKVRQHVNPLSSKYQIPVNLPGNWMCEAFEDAQRPLIIDVGCAKGSWLLKMAGGNSSCNFLGLEIRRPVVELCLRRKEFYGLRNTHFLAVNANVDLRDILSSLRDKEQPIQIQAVTIQFPDPHFKARHKKRRVVNPDLVNCLAKYLPADTLVFLQSDIQELEVDMISHFQNSCRYFTPAEGFDLTALEGNPNPFSTETEREIATRNKQLPVYRMLFRRNGTPYGDITE